VRVSGQLDATGAAELHELCGARSGALILDLEELVAVDPAALATLRALREEGGRVIGASHYIRLLLDGDTGR
jgi:anti-anti-sigma regulatory factor